jgi:hypothetical protein
MEKRVGWRARATALGSILAITAALVVAGGTAASATTTQGSSLLPVNNFAGPAADCPGAGWNCTTDTNVVQNSGGGQNVYEAQGVGGSVTQNNTTGPNKATCNVSTTAAASTQTCSITQNGDGGNTINATFSAAPNSGQVNLGTITQSAAQRLVTSQNSTNGNNTLTATTTINEQANSLVDASTPVTHTQDSFVFAGVKQVANGTGNNSATLQLNRTLASTTRGGPPTELQDSKAIPSTADIDTSACEGNALANGNACVYQRANGAASTNYLKVREADVKTENGTDLTSSNATQQQGRNGQTEWLAVNDVQTPNNLPGTTVDNGTSGGSDGLTKNWTIRSQGLLGGAIPGTRAQYDEILLHSIGRLSPWNETSNEKSTLSAPDGTHQIVAIGADGHADGNWTGQLNANMAAGTKTQQKTVNFSNTDVNVSLDCEQNNDVACGTSGVSGSGTNFSATEGQAFSGQKTATFTDPNPSHSYTATIDWGDGHSDAGVVTSDGNGHYIVTGAHTYAEEGADTVTTTLQQGSTNVAATRSTATVSDAPLSASGKTLTANASSFSGSVASFSDADTAAPVSDFSASIDWGDGSAPTAGTVASAGGGSFNVSGSHNYATRGQYTITTTINDVGGSSATATSTLTGYSFAPGGAFSIGDGNSAIGSNVTWWGSQWSAANTLSGGAAPSSYKGFENSSTNPTCGTNWTSTGGNSPPPASSVPHYMATIVTSKVTSGSNTKFSGNTVEMVVVKTNSGYNPNTGSAGTGTVVAVIGC